MQTDQIVLDEATLPAHLRSKLPTFQTERFEVVPLNPPPARELVEGLLQDQRLAEYVAWLEDKSPDGVRREALLLELQCAAGNTLAWGIVESDSTTFIGALLARPTIEGLDLEVLCRLGTLGSRRDGGNRRSGGGLARRALRNRDDDPKLRG